MEFVLFLPQMRLSFADLVARARAAEAAGFTGIAGMDHLAPPMAEDKPMYDAMVTTTWLAAHTERLRVGSLVLCDAFHEPSVLAKQAVAIDHASGGRFELGIGWGSVPTEFETFGVGESAPGDRVARLRETLEVVTALWAGETVEHAGRFHQLRGARQEPRPLTRIPIVIGGAGPKTLALVRDFADWWNLDVVSTERIEELRPSVGDARVSVQHMVTFVPEGGDRDSIVATAQRRFRSAAATGTADELVEQFEALAARGVERVYAWFTDFAPVATLEEFGETVAARLS